MKYELRVTQQTSELMRQQVHTEENSNVLILTTHEKYDYLYFGVMNRVRHSHDRWSITCREGIIQLKGKEYLFGRCVCTIYLSTNDECI